MVLNVKLIGIHWVVDYVGTNMDVVATTEDVANLHLLCVKSTIKNAPAAGTGGVSGGANVTVTAAVEVPESALLLISFNCSYAEEDMLFELITTHNV